MDPDVHLCALIFLKDIISYFSGNETETVVKSQAPHCQDWCKTAICKFENFTLQGGKNINSNQVQSIADLLISVAFFLPFKIYIRFGTPKTEIQKNKIGNIQCDRGNRPFRQSVVIFQQLYNPISIECAILGTIPALKKENSQIRNDDNCP